MHGDAGSHAGPATCRKTVKIRGEPTPGTRSGELDGNSSPLARLSNLPCQGGLKISEPRARANVDR